MGINLNAGQDIFVVFAYLGIGAGFPNWALLVEYWFDWEVFESHS